MKSHWIRGSAAIVVLLAAAAAAVGARGGFGQEDDEGGSPRRRARNVIFFVGDGMGVSTITAARVFSVGVAGELRRDGHEPLDLGVEEGRRGAEERVARIDPKAPRPAHPPREHDPGV